MVSWACQGTRGSRGWGGGGRNKWGAERGCTYVLGYDLPRVHVIHVCAHVCL